MTPNKEDYLKAIYEIGSQEAKISNKHIASRMQVSPPAVTEMMKKLISEGLITKDKSKGYLLTEAGQAGVAALYRKHRLIEVFLIEHLHYAYEQIHQEAEVLEHTVSDHFINALDRLLDYPETCPHGGQIPRKGQAIHEIYRQTLTPDSPPGDYVLRRVHDHRELLEYLKTIHLSIGTAFTLENYDSYTGLYHLQVQGQTVQVPENIASHFYIG
ncbi:metal-dependent transcriptional regulator [Streptococcus sp. DD12]|uniref:metal-dependent transcriptional regulator n=1 Tax=Streptococcus sp. DD12 TaxID=1777880 RepID=UPI000791D205|nr:metal-dependent transcriptional regulator [Streptococcus sp. DD12]KXT77013.1 Mn-dependent transcriptional regulator MntR [Streptococcus sp. DD12]